MQSVAPSVKATTINAPLQVQDPVLEARASLALLIGSPHPHRDGERHGGLVGQVKRDVSTVLERYERAFEPGTPPPDLDTMYDTLDTLISILARSPLGGYPSSNPAELDLETATRTVQRLFKDVQRTKEGAEIVRAGLAA